MVERKDVDALSQGLADAAGAAARIRAQLDAKPGPLALLLSMRVGTIESLVGTSLERLQDLGDAITSLSPPDEP